ncbi:MAG: hypothetical protein ACK4V1_10995, partial [Burkholderiaceae bacterium]
MTEFRTRDPAQAAFWDERFAANYTPWDQGAVPPALVRWLAQAPLAAGARVLIPGCGSAYEAASLDAAGFDVPSIDVAGPTSSLSPPLGSTRSTSAPSCARCRHACGRRAPPPARGLCMRGGPRGGPVFIEDAAPPPPP